MVVSHWLLQTSIILLWRSQFLKLDRFIDSTIVQPSRLLPDSTPNPGYATWFKIDQTIQSWLLATLSQAALGQMLGLTSAHAMWYKLERLYASQSQSRILHMRFKLQTIRRGSQPTGEYLDRIKSLADSLFAAGSCSPLEPRDVVSYTLGGLGSDYEPFVMSITARPDPIVVEDLHHLLLQ